MLGSSMSNGVEVVGAVEPSALSSYDVSLVIHVVLFASVGGSHVDLVDLIAMLVPPNQTINDIDEALLIVGLVLVYNPSSLVLSPAVPVFPVAVCSSGSPVINGELVVYGAVDCDVSPTVAVDSIALNDINCCVNLRDSLIYADGAELSNDNSVFLVDGGNESLTDFGEA
ncbi:hypothetical protein KFK09_029121 [Dendrobium nobile]|uniref:Uncharacterized protein n=1 Tax=Dendrobium nobile TaxID=94219 RepID=A0A8T3A5D6_DENNO|nr:hypothetical protein KFK09_029121 [Dendrobium nobile]